MKPIKHAVKSILATAVLAVGVSSAQAAPTTALYLTMDGSGSISGAQFTQQITSYVTALNNVATQEITDATILGNLTSALSALDPGRGGINTGATAIGDAITLSANALTAYETSLGADIKLLIDVTTDGANNLGSNPATVADAVTPPIDSVNCLGIGGAANCSWVGTSGTNFGNAADFVAFQGALEAKLKQEFDVPEPGTLAVLGLGLLGMVASRRKQ